MRTTPGFKFNHYELLGVPVRVELGMRDVEKGTHTLTLTLQPQPDASTASITVAPQKRIDSRIPGNYQPFNEELGLTK